jgi:hypothetical protein
MLPIGESARLACRNYEPLLEDYLSGCLSQSESEGVQKHVAVCSACSDALGDARASVRLLRASLDTQAGLLASPSFSRTVMARIRQQESLREVVSLWQPFVSLAWKFVATASLALLIMATYARTGRGPEPEQVQVASALQSEAHADLFAPDPATPPASRDEVVLMMADADYANK